MNGRSGEGDELERSLPLCLYREAKSQKDDHGAGRKGSSGWAATGLRVNLESLELRVGR